MRWDSPGGREDQGSNEERYATLAHATWSVRARDQEDARIHHTAKGKAFVSVPSVGAEREDVFSGWIHARRFCLKN